MANRLDQNTIAEIIAEAQEEKEKEQDKSLGFCESNSLEINAVYEIAQRLGIPTQCVDHALTKRNKGALIAEYNPTAVTIEQQQADLARFKPKISSIGRGDYGRSELISMYTAELLKGLRIKDTEGIFLSNLSTDTTLDRDSKSWDFHAWIDFVRREKMTWSEKAMAWWTGTKTEECLAQTIVSVPQRQVKASVRTIIYHPFFLYACGDALKDLEENLKGLVNSQFETRYVVHKP